eukprot:764979-Amorphochlora_amoeboformis.AAC.1
MMYLLIAVAGGVAFSLFSGISAVGAGMGTGVRSTGVGRICRNSVCMGPRHVRVRSRRVTVNWVGQEDRYGSRANRRMRAWAGG